MSIRNLERLLKPKSVALIGASKREGSVGTRVLDNLLGGGFEGPVFPVNPKYTEIAGNIVYKDVASLPQAPDLAVICTPRQTVPGLIAELGDFGTRAAVVLTAGLSQEHDASGRTLEQAMLDAARPYLLRILGPNCVGLLLPNQGLNASFAHAHALPGKLAMVTQSGALVTAVLDWASSRQIGFSHFVSVGNGADVDFGDLLDYLGGDADTRAILLYIESIDEPRKFMSAARAAARNKPVVVVKSGRVAEAARAAASHTGALAGSDAVYDAAIRRAGMLRVDTTEDLFDAVETLARVRPCAGEALAILTNGGGPGVMATDALIEAGGKLAALSATTVTALDAVLPVNWSRGNPVDIVGDAPAQRYLDALQILAQAPEVDAVLFIHAPTAIVSSAKLAAALAPVIRDIRKSVLSCWLGGDGVRAARECFANHALATYDSPEDGARAFMQLVDYRRNQAALTETPSSIPSGYEPDRQRAGEIIKTVLDERREWLDETEAKRLLAAYGIPVVETRSVSSVEEAVENAAAIGFPVVVKVLSPDITHKSDVGGVVLDLESEDQVRAACQAIDRRAAEIRPDARLEGFAIQSMVRKPGAHELILGAAEDAIFGPVLLFGQGGTAVEVVGDRAVALPPLNQVLARDLVQRTRVAKLLAGYRDRPAADLDAIHETLIKMSQLIVDLPEVTEMDINPLLADADGVVALDARVRVAPASAAGDARLAIRPYPKRLEEAVDFDGKRILLRPIKPEDEPAHRELFNQLKPEDVRFRFFGQVREFSHSQMARYTQIDYDREMAIIAVDTDAEGRPQTLGVARAVTDPNLETAEFAVIVRSGLKGRGLGGILMDKLIRYCSDRGISTLVGEVLENNRRMLGLAQRLGFDVTLTADGVYQVRLALAAGETRT